MALWNGNINTNENKTERIGCGTTDIVRIAEEGSYNPISGISFRSVTNESVIHIYTPGKDEQIKDKEMVGVVNKRNNWDAVKKIIFKTNQFNKSAKIANIEEIIIDKKKKKEDKLILEILDIAKEIKIEALEHLCNIFLIWDDLSVTARDEYKSALGGIAILGTIITFLFLLYDEAEKYFLILFCGVTLLIGLLILHIVNKSACHERYIEYRVLAEDLRVQAYLCYARSRLRVADLLPWTQQEETGWIMDAISVLIAGREFNKEEKTDMGAVKKNIKENWIQEQKKYHDKKAQQEDDNPTIKEPKEKLKLKNSVVDCINLIFKYIKINIDLIKNIDWIKDILNNPFEGLKEAFKKFAGWIIKRLKNPFGWFKGFLKKIVGWTIEKLKNPFGLSIALYIITLLFEVFCGGWLCSPFVSISNMDYYRSWLKILLGTTSAWAIFRANYYGKLSPQRIHADHINMSNFYKKMDALLENNKEGISDELLTAMAHEMLIENGNCYSYQKDNTPDINI